MGDFKTFPLQIRFHPAIPNWAKFVGLKIRTVHECEGGGFMIDKGQAERIMAALYPTELFKKTRPQPTHYTTEEGGAWYIWKDYHQARPFKNNNHNAHVIKFEDGSIFDMVNGWRQDIKYSCDLCKDTQRVWDGEFHIKCPKCGQQNQS